MMKVVSNEGELIREAMLNKDEPFIIDEIMEKFDRGRDSISNHAKHLVDSDELFQQQVSGAKYFISKKKIDMSEVVKIRNSWCIYSANENIYKKICESHCKRANRGCDAFSRYFKNSV